MHCVRIADFGILGHTTLCCVVLCCVVLCCVVLCCVVLCCVVLCCVYECENIFCIYRGKGQCSLNIISLDIYGCCNDCIYVKIEEINLEYIRKSMLTEYDKNYEEWVDI